MISTRKAALDALNMVLLRHLSLDDAMAAIDPMEDRDRAFVLRLAATTLRRLGQIDALVDQCLASPLPAKAGAVRQVLRLAAAQLVFLATPAHAAVDTAVDLVRTIGFPGHAKLVNALARRFAREGAAIVADQDAERLNTPDWLWKSWQTAYGEATARAIASAHLAEAPLDITLKSPVDGAVRAEQLGAEILPWGSLRRPAGGAVATLPGFADGAWWIQDAAASLPVRLLGPVAGLRVADLCAAPGGKTAQLAAGGAHVIAVDRSARRLERLAANLARLDLSAEVIAADATAWKPEAPCDALLIDAPCSATGTLRRHPDAPHLKHAEDLAKLTGLQARLLAGAADLLRPGGKLIYCTCSLQPEEGRQQVDAFLASGAPFVRRPVSSGEIPGLPDALLTDGDLRSLPCHLGEKGGMDGFYAARLERL